MNTSKEVLARSAASRLVAAACVSKGEQWSRQEEIHRQATTRDGERKAAAPLLRVCATCPIIAECRTWAAIDEYTGIAAGTEWSHGSDRREPQRRRRRAG